MAVIYLFSPQLVCLGAVEAASLVQSEAAYQVTAELRTTMEITSGFCIGFFHLDAKFRLYEIDSVDYRDDPGDLYITGTDLAVRELTDIVVTDIRCDAMTASAALAHLLEASNSGWVVGDVVTTDATSSRHYYKSLWESVVVLMDKYQVRMVPYFTISAGCAITARKIDIISLEPVYRGRLVESGDDAGSVVVTVSGNPKTALYGRGKGVEAGTTETGDAYYGPRLTFADVVWSTANGDPVNKPLHQEWVGDDTAKAAFGRGGDHRYGVAIFEDITDPEELLQATWDYLQKVAWPTVSATAAMYDIEMAEGYTYAAIRVNDLIVIRPRLFPADVTATVTQIHRDYVNPANTRLEISTTGVAVTAANLYSQTTQKLQTTQNEMSNVITHDSVIDTMVTKIMSSGTDMYTDPTSGALVFVSDDGTSAMMLTGAGWMIADTKVGDVWQWRTAATGDGIVADEITTGMLQASVVKIFGSDHFYWDSENSYIKEGTGFAMHLNGVTLTKSAGGVYTWYLQNYTTLGGTTQYAWNGSRVAGGTTVHIEWTDAPNAFTFRYDDGGSWHTLNLSAGDGSQQITIQNYSNIGVFDLTYGDIVTLNVYSFVGDMTDVGTTWDLGDITIPATESPWSGVLKYACTLGVYTLSVTSITTDTDVTISTVNLSTSAETTVGRVTAGNWSESFTRIDGQFDLMAKRAAPSLRQIRIGRYDGTNYGIGYTTDGGVTWQIAMDFNGLAVNGNAVSLTTQGSYIQISGSTFLAGAGSYVNIASGGELNLQAGANFYCRAGSVANFVTDDFVLQNADGRNLMTVSSIEGKEGQIFLGDEGFPVNFAGDFILPVANGGTGYNFGQVHRITTTPSASLGEDGDLAIKYASSSGAYSAFTPTITNAATKAGSVATYGGMERYWNDHYGVDNAIPQNHWAAGNDNGYCYGIEGTFVSPQNAVSGAITIEVTGYKYYNNSAGLTAYIVDGLDNVLGTASILLAYRSSGTVSGTFTSVSLAANTTYRILICDPSGTRGNTSKSYIEMGTVTFPAYSGSSACGLYIKSAGSWVTVFQTT